VPPDSVQYDPALGQITLTAPRDRSTLGVKSVEEEWQLVTNPGGANT
jgi:hypothetical protein